MRFLLWIGAAAALLHAQPREVAITIDDLPLGGGQRVPCAAEPVADLTRRLLKPFRDRKLPVIGFVNEGRCGETLSAAQLRSILDIWLDSGADLGNHTYSHPDFNRVSLAEFQADVVKGETILKAALESRNRKLLYFRHPFLHAGPDEAKRKGLESFLKARGYTVAPVTIDNSDYMYAAVYAQALSKGDKQLAARVREEYLPYMESMFEFFEKRGAEVAGHEIRQILLLHVNELNADAMPDLLAMMQRRGYRIVPLDRALQDPAYQLPDSYFGPGGFSWIHRWSRTKGMPPKGEADPSSFITKAYEDWRAGR